MIERLGERESERGRYIDSYKQAERERIERERERWRER